jgi:hypothetical protein
MVFKILTNAKLIVFVTIDATLRIERLGPENIIFNLLLDGWLTVFNLKIASFKVCIEWSRYFIILIQFDSFKNNMSLLANHIPIPIDQVTSSIDPFARPIQ